VSVKIRELPLVESHSSDPIPPLDCSRRIISLPDHSPDPVNDGAATAPPGQKDCASDGFAVR
jgi:hypothetical protein